MSIEYAVDHQLSLDHLSFGLYIRRGRWTACFSCEDNWRCSGSV